MNDGGPAFPKGYNYTDYEMQRGMSLRDYFAAKAPISFDVALRVWGDVDAPLADDTTRRAFIAVWAMLRYDWADEMLEARKK